MPETITAPEPALATPAPTEADRSAPPSIGDFDSHFPEDDVAPEPQPEPTPTPEPKSPPPKDPTSGKFIKAEPKTEPKPEPKAEPKPAAKPVEHDEYTPPQVATGGALRKFAEQAGTKARQLANELNSVRAELTKFKSHPQEDTAKVVAELADAKKRLQEYERELQTTRYERSSEYKEKYEKPYQNAYRQAYSDVKELLVYEPNPDDPEHPRERQATTADFDEIYGLPLGPATRLAKQKFGDSASIVIQHRAAIKNLAKSAIDAVNERNAGAEQYEQQQLAQQKMQDEGRSQMFSTAIQYIQTRHASMFQRENDSEWAEKLSNGRAMADMAFSNRHGMTEQQKVILDAHVYSRLVLAPALMWENAKLRAKEKKLESDIAQMRDSSPGKVQPTGKPAPTSPKGWAAEFDEKVPE